MLTKITTKTRLYFDSFINPFRRRQIIIITETDNWVLQNISSKLTSLLPNTSLSTSVSFLQNKTIHFSSIHSYISQRQKVNPSNKVIVTWYHFNDRLIEKEIIKQISHQPNTIIHTACQKTKSDLVQNGLPAEKIIIIPLGIDIKLFTSTSPEKKLTARQCLNLPPDKIIIGSFQKDGVGWNEGLEPKLIKGPDIFCDTVEKLSKKFPLHILLTGPARGYVKNRLTAANIPFTHHYLKHYKDIVPYYHALDLYLIASRVEGGPMALLESWATGTPLVTTPVGMVPDICLHEKNALVSQTFNPDELAELSERALTDYQLAARLTANGLQQVTQFDWSVISEQYFQQLYQPLI